MFQLKKLTIIFTTLLLIFSLTSCGENKKVNEKGDENNVSIDSLVEQELAIVNNAESVVFASSLKGFLLNSKMNSLSAGLTVNDASLNSDLLTFMGENGNFTELRGIVLVNKVSFSGRVNGVKCSIDFDLSSGSQLNEASCG